MISCPCAYAQRHACVQVIWSNALQSCCRESSWKGPMALTPLSLGYWMLINSGLYGNKNQPELSRSTDN